MNVIGIIDEHTAFDVYRFQKFEICYKNVKLSSNGELEI